MEVPTGIPKSVIPMKFGSLTRIAGLVVCAHLLNSTAATTAAAALFMDTLENGLGSWQTTGTWGTETAQVGSPTHAVTESPGAFYSSNSNSALTLIQPLDLSAVTRPAIAFRHAFDLENGYDFARVETSTDGINWTEAASYTGYATARREQLELGQLAGESNVRLRLRVETDPSVVKDGWRIDDIVVGEAPSPVLLQPATAVQRTSLQLEWSASSAGNFSAYQILRTTQSPMNWREAHIVATLSAKTTTTYTDITVSPKSTYAYRVLTIDSDGLHSLSNEITVQTPAGMDFPFLDDAEGGAGHWIPDATWGITNEAARSGTHAWSDSPGSDYENNLSARSLTLAAPLDLSSTSHPVWTFWYRCALASGDSAHAEISTNGGISWSVLGSLSAADNTEEWSQARIQLDAYKGTPVLLRLRLTTNATVTADGLQIDDISVAEAPVALPVPAVSDINPYGCTLNWAPSVHPQLHHYAIYRGQGTNATWKDTLVATIPPDAQLQHTDIGLLPNTAYAFRIYAVTTYGTYSDDNAEPARLTTPSQTVPHADSFENGNLAWTFGSNNANPSQWAITNEDAADGDYCLTDSPLASYATSTDSYAETSVDLTGATWPILAFTDKFSLGTSDWIRLEISAPGDPTEYYYGHRQDTQSEWTQQLVDLSQWKGNPNVKIRFRLVSDGGATPGDGWFIDQVQILENPDAATPLELPFMDGFEGSLANHHIAAGWSAIEDPDAIDGSFIARSSKLPYLASDTDHYLVLGKALELPANSHVQVTLRFRGELRYRSYLRIHYSTNGGDSWNELTDANVNHDYLEPENWGRVQADLSFLAGQTVRLRIGHLTTGAPESYLELDKLTIAERPAGRNLLFANPGLRSVSLTWSANPLGADFQRCELWRSTSPNVNPSTGTLVFSTTNPATPGTTDGGLSIGGTYYYKLFTIDKRDTYIPSNELSATTVPLLLSVADSMDSLDNWLVGTNNTQAPAWSVVADDVGGGSGCIATTEVGQYAPSTDSYIETAINLTGTNWPVMTFWDKYDLAAGDWVRVEISATGGPTEYYYGRREGSRMDWQKQAIDLSQWKGLANVKIRFRFVSNGDALIGQGWFIDDFAVAENPDAGQALVLPFTEDFEDDLAVDWIPAGWVIKSDTQPVDGAAVGSTLQGGIPSSDADLYMVLDREIELAADSHVQATFWFRGELRYRSYLRLHYSTNDGATWNEVAEANRNNDYLEPESWGRVQADLSFLAGQTVRLRVGLVTLGGPVSFLELDKFTLAERPAASDLISASPSLRSVALTWNASQLGDEFKRYELWRSTTSNVFSSTNPATTSASDGGLNIGGTYYYKLFTVDQRDTFIPSNELSITTVPLTLPLADSLDDLGNWVVGSNNANDAQWSLVTTGVYQGTGCLGVVPVGQYAPSTDSYAETALDLTGSNWPVLTFWDKYELGTGDWFRLEISASGGPTEYYYGRQSGSRLEWRKQAIDLSQWKGLANVKVRFRFLSNGDASVGQGWFIDDLMVMENPSAAVPLSLPLEENFEESLDANWISAGWRLDASVSAREGSAVATSHDGALLSSDVDAYMVLARALTLPADSRVLATLWFRGELRYRSYLRLYYSTNGGLTWSEVTEANRNFEHLEPENWTRVQADLSGLAGQTIRLRVGIVTLGAPNAYLQLDKLTLAEQSSAPTAQPIDQVAITSLRLNWLPVSIPDFQEYRIYRSMANDVSPVSSDWVATISESGATSFTDTDLEARKTYYYKIYAVNDRDTYAGSDTVSATTLGLTLPLVDDFESGTLPGWTHTGNWQIVDGLGRNGGAALVDSPGDYEPSKDTHARFAVDLTGMDWPVLRFWDKFAFAGNSWGRLEISTDGNTWNAFPYGVTGTRGEWRRKQVDLSQWKGLPRVFIRFRTGTDGNTAEGWTIDDLVVEEHQQTPLTSVWDDFESDSGLWLSTRWIPSSDNPKEGASCLADSPEGRYGPDAQNLLTLASELDLTEAVNPSVSLYLRGNLAYRSYFRIQVSTNGGVTWTDISGMSRSNDYNQSEWEFLTASLQSWVGQAIRLRILSWGLGQPNSSLWIDAVGIGEQEPLAPSIASPKTGDVASERRPLLTVDNAIDFQSDNLSYRFEVYGDEAMTQLVAQVPVVASGLTQTSWTVDVNLTDKAPYWWRARAFDGANEGPWTATSQFFVSEYNTPPPAVPQIAPPSGALLLDSDQWLVWKTVLDADPGESIQDYHLQIDDDPAFGSPLVDRESVLAQPFASASGNLIGIPLRSLDAVGQLTTGRWYWRVRARDGRQLYGSWPAQGLLFRIPSDFELWVVQTFSAEQQDNPLISSPAADPDADGIPLLMEYACGMDTSAADSAGAPHYALLRSGNNLHHSWSFKRRAGTNAVFIIEQSSDLEQWTEVPYTLEVLETLPDGTQRCRMTDPAPMQPDRFVRLTLRDQ